jgi:endonuclease/exonuclease/phosphatase family metal-dependent hydrolase
LRIPTSLQCGAASLLALWAGALSTSNACAQTVDTLNVMTYNILVGGANYGPLSRTVGVIQSAQADVIGIQEVGGSAQAIANSLGFYYHGFNSDLAIISRYPITQAFNEGVRLQLSPTQDAFLFDVHFSAYPYQPYDIRDGLITTEAQAIAAAQATRGGQVASLISDMAAAMSSNLPVFLTGDFNEPSHLDWTQAAANAGLHFGKKVAWPTSTAVVNSGLTDSFRQLRPDVINDRGNTWTPGSPAPTQTPNEVFDRIDFVYYTGANVTPQSALTLGYDAADPDTDIGIQPYPSDHRSVVVQFHVPACTMLADLSGNCSLGVEDWMQFRAGQLADMTGLSHAQAYAMGDLNGDFRNDHADFVVFKDAYDTAHGAGAFAAMLTAVPEPSAALLAYGCGVALMLVARSRGRVGQALTCPGCAMRLRQAQA